MRVEDVVHHEVFENLDFIPTGPLPPNRSDFLLHVNFTTLLEAAGSNYDLVLIDTPPILLASDALIIGNHAGAIFLLARARITTDAEITESIKRLNHAGLSPRGVLFNDMALRIGSGRTQYIDDAAQLGYST
jgi:tyrosine-protein kinase Etk/Wzc